MKLKVIIEKAKKAKLATSQCPQPQLFQTINALFIQYLATTPPTERKPNNHQDQNNLVYIPQTG